MEQQDITVTSMDMVAIKTMIMEITSMVMTRFQVNITIEMKVSLISRPHLLIFYPRLKQLTMIELNILRV